MKITANKKGAGGQHAAGQSGGRGARYHCDYCRIDITHVMRIKCAVCEDFDMCLECFAAGMEVFPHSNTHAYRVMSHVTTPIFEAEWGADEELLLLEGIEMFGLGNWSDVADHIGSKSKQKCEDHYHDIFLASKCAPLPDPDRMIGREERQQLDAARRAEQQGAGAGVSTDAAVSAARAREKEKFGLGHLVGYMPKRGDFATEYENEVENHISDMEFLEEDTKWERDLKLKVLEIYNCKLDARAERKRFILERGLLQKKPEKSMTKDEREVRAAMRVFARFQTHEEHEQLVAGLVNERVLRRRIEQLQQQRLNGVRTLEDGDVYEAERAKRDQAKRTLAYAAQQAKTSSSIRASGADALLASRPLPGSKKRPLSDAEFASFVPAAKRRATGEDGSSKRGSAAASSTITQDLDLRQIDGIELLSERERKLCSELQLLPQHYMVLKERILRESFNRGFINPGQTRQLIKIDVKKTNRMLDFFVSAGWVRVVEDPLAD